MVLLCVWLIPFVIFILPFTLETFTNLLDKHDKELNIKICSIRVVRHCVALDVVIKIIIFVMNYFSSKYQSILDMFLRYSSFFIGTTLEVTFCLICFELVTRVNYATKTLKVLRKTATINVNARRMQIISLQTGLQYLIQAKYVAAKGFRFFLLINVIRHFMFILASAVSSLCSGTIEYSSLTFLSIVCYSLAHYFIFSLCADHLQKKVCYFLPRSRPRLKIYLQAENLTPLSIGLHSIENNSYRDYRVTVGWKII